MASKVEIITPDGKNFLDIIFPIGSIYKSTSSKKPGELFGGT